MMLKYSRVLFAVGLLAVVVACGGGDNGNDEPPVVVPPAEPEPVPPKPNVIVIFTDDQGYADLGIQGQLSDLKTPNIDKLAQNGAHFTHGYVTSPQCTPSRAAMHTGQYQQRFGVDENKFTPMPLEAETLGERFKRLGYKTGMIGKWHLDIDGNSREWGGVNYPEIEPFNVNNVPFDERRKYFPDARGYDDTLYGFTGRYWRNYNLDGTSTEPGYINTGRDRLEFAGDMAVSFINRHHSEPFYLHVSPYGPHVPLAAAQKYLNRFPGDMPERRRYALAMLSAIDDGVGKIVDALEQYQLLDNTLIYFISDNGAPLGDDMEDEPISKLYATWDGSMNVPFIGEKGMLTEGGIRVPYIVQWQGHIDPGIVIDKPVSSLDAAYTALKLAGDKDLASLDGVDLLPATKGDDDYLDSRPLFWRFYKQRAIRLGKWKYLQAGIAREYLFDLESDTHESVNLINAYPDIAESLREKYLEWNAQMLRPDDTAEIERPFQIRYDNYLPPN